MKERLPNTGQTTVMLDVSQHGLPEVKFLGIHSQSRAGRGLATHVHEGCMEIVYLAKGELIFRVGGHDYPMQGNDVFWTHADEPHGSGRNAYDKAVIYWTQIRLPRSPRRFLTLDKHDAWPLVQALRRLPSRRFPGHWRLRVLFEEAFRIGRQAPSPLVRLGLAMHMVEWLRTMVECARRDSEPKITPDVGRALSLVNSCAGGDVSIEEMAYAARLSTSRFKAKFRVQMGLPPGEYVLRRRVQQARELLEKTDDSVTDIALRLGFSSSQYFSHVFRRFMNQRPSDMRRHRREGDH